MSSKKFFFQKLPIHSPGDGVIRWKQKKQSFAVGKVAGYNNHRASEPSVSLQVEVILTQQKTKLPLKEDAYYGQEN